jgi:hypothetical protein
MQVYTDKQRREIIGFLLDAIKDSQQVEMAAKASLFLTELRDPPEPRPLNELIEEARANA